MDEKDVTGHMCVRESGSQEFFDDILVQLVFTNPVLADYVATQGLPEFIVTDTMNVYFRNALVTNEDVFELRRKNLLRELGNNQIIRAPNDIKTIPLTVALIAHTNQTVVDRWLNVWIGIPDKHIVATGIDLAHFTIGHWVSVVIEDFDHRTRVYSAGKQGVRRQHTPRAHSNGRCFG